MADPNMNNLERLLDCPVCLKQLVDHRVLSCGHVFCLDCLVRTLGSSIELVCPICREVTSMETTSSIKDLPKVPIINDLQGQIMGISVSDPARRPKSRPCDLCTSEIPETAAFYCHQCSECLCDQCHNQHQAASALKDHIIDVIGHMKFCSFHKGVILDKYCVTCRLILCKRCIIKGHTNHSSDDLQPIVSAKRQHLQKLHTDIEKAKCELQKSLEFSETHILEADIESVSSLVLDKCTELKENLSKLISLIDSDMENVTDDMIARKQKLSEYRASAGRQQRDFEITLDQIEGLLSSQDDYDLDLIEELIDKNPSDGVGNKPPQCPEYEYPSLNPEYLTTLLDLVQDLNQTKQRPDGQTRDRKHTLSDAATRGMNETSSECYWVEYVTGSSQHHLESVLGVVLGETAVDEVRYHEDMEAATVYARTEEGLMIDLLRKVGLHWTAEKVPASYISKEETWANCVIITTKVPFTKVLLGDMRKALSQLAGDMEIIETGSNLSIDYNIDTKLIQYNKLLVKCLCLPGVNSFKTIFTEMIGGDHKQSPFRWGVTAVEDVTGPPICVIEGYLDSSNFSEKFIKRLCETKQGGGCKIKNITTLDSFDVDKSAQWRKNFLWFFTAEEANRACVACHDLLDSRGLDMHRYIPGFGAVKSSKK